MRIYNIKISCFLIGNLIFKCIYVHVTCMNMCLYLCYFVTSIFQLQGSLDSNVQPCTDFWKYSCGGWLEDNLIPPTRSSWTVRDKLKHQGNV